MAMLLNEGMTGIPADWEAQFAMLADPMMAEQARRAAALRMAGNRRGMPAMAAPGPAAGAEAAIDPAMLAAAGAPYSLPADPVPAPAARPGYEATAGYLPPSTGFPKMPQENFDEGAMVQAASEAAAKRVAGQRKPAGVMPGGEALPFGGMGLLGTLMAQGDPASMAAMMPPDPAANPAAVDPAAIPENSAPTALDRPPTNDPLSMEPQVFKGDVPIPRDRPGRGDLGAEPGAPMSLSPTDISSQSRPEPAAPPSTRAAARPAAAADPTDTGSGVSGILNKILKPENAPLWFALGGGFAGAPSLSTGLRRASSAAVAPAALIAKTKQTEATQAETYRALVQRGVNPQEALAATRSPEMMKALVAKYFETKPAQVVNNRVIRERPGGGVEVLADFSDDKAKWTQVGTDRWGSPVHGLVDLNNQTINGKPIAEYQDEQSGAKALPGATTMPGGYPNVPAPAAPGAVPGPGAAAPAAGASAQQAEAPDVLPGTSAPVAGNRNEEYLTSLGNPALASQVKAIAEGRAPYPSGQVMRTPYGRMITEAVASYDPSFDAVNYKSREQTRLKFTKGKGADNLTSFGTTIGHLGSLNEAIDGLQNSNFPLWNKLGNAVSGSYDPKFQAAAKKFEASRTAVADELTRSFRGSGGNVHDIKQWEQTINGADSPAALRAAVKQAAELLRSRIEAVGDEYNRGMGTTADPLSLLNPKAAAAFEELHGMDVQKGNGATKEAPAVKPGQMMKTKIGIPWSIN